MCGIRYVCVRPARNAKREISQIVKTMLSRARWLWGGRTPKERTLSIVDYNANMRILVGTAYKSILINRTNAG